MKSEKPIHLLLNGPPSSGKTLFLMSLLKLPKSRYYLGGQTSKAGLTEILLKEKIEYLILDEIDKMNGRDYDALLSLMETGRVVRCKFKMWDEGQLNTRVYAACNYVERIPLELLSRFLVIDFKPYTREEFIAVSKHVLKVREGLTEEEAETVANLLADRSRDVRDSIKAGRLLKAWSTTRHDQKNIQQEKPNTKNTTLKLKPKIPHFLFLSKTLKGFLW
jgi:Holliday junction DNA helicase RuvB